MEITKTWHMATARTIIYCDESLEERKGGVYGSRFHNCDKKRNSANIQQRRSTAAMTMLKKRSN
jgi:hypothetical protein